MAGVSVTVDSSDPANPVVALAGTVTNRPTFNSGAATSPFQVGGASIGVLVTGLNADKLDGNDASDFAAAVHTHAASAIVSGRLALARGGTDLDASATGGAKHVVMQESAGAAFTVRILATTDIPDLSATYLTPAAAAAAYQPLDADLTAIAALTSAADRVPYATGAGTWALAVFTGAGRALVDDADAAAQRTTLGLGTIATFNDAPSDGSTYGRKDGAWAVAGGGSAAWESSGGDFRAVPASVASGDRFVYTSKETDGATQIAHVFDVSNTFSTAGAKLLSIKNNGTEKLAIDKGGNLTVAGGVYGSATGFYLYETDGYGSLKRLWTGIQEVELHGADFLRLNSANGGSLRRGGTAIAYWGNAVFGVNYGVLYNKQTAPGAPAADTAIVYVDDNGAGKLRLMVRFPSGAAQQIAIEP